jgi:BRCT domain type II-containing protein
VHLLTAFSEVTAASDDTADGEPEVKKAKTAKKVSKRTAVPDGDPQSLLGKTCMLAGTLHHMDHKTFVQTVEVYGGTLTSKIADVDFLVIGANPGKKAEEAAEKGVNTIDEENFFGAIGADYPEPAPKRVKK